MELTKEQEVLQQVINEAWENENFKTQLLENPVAAIENLTGTAVNLKGNIKMVVVDQSDSNTFYFNIPPQPSLDSQQLSEHQLEMVAGGVGNPLEWFNNAKKKVNEVIDAVNTVIDIIT